MALQPENLFEHPHPSHNTRGGGGCTSSIQLFFEKGVKQFLCTKIWCHQILFWGLLFSIFQFKITLEPTILIFQTFLNCVLLLSANFGVQKQTKFQNIDIIDRCQNELLILLPIFPQYGSHCGRLFHNHPIGEKNYQLWSLSCQMVQLQIFLYSDMIIFTIVISTKTLR